MKYSIIYTDNPWRYADQKANDPAMGGITYPTMTVAELSALPVADLAAKDCVLFSWATMPLLREALQVIEAWGFVYTTCGFTWVKLNPRGEGIYSGLGHWCLGGATQVHVCHKETHRVEELTVGELVRRDAAYYWIHTHRGWKQLKSIWMNGIRPVGLLRHRLGVTRCTDNHRWAVKHLSTPRREGGGRIRDHVVEYLPVTELERLAKGSTATSGGASVNLVFSTHPIESPEPCNEKQGIALSYDTGWLIGLYAAEGHCQKTQIRFTLGSRETELIERVGKIVDSWGLFHPRFFRQRVQIFRYEHKDKAVVSVYFGSSQVKTLIKTFVQGDRAATKSLNIEEFLQTSVEFRQGFVDGYLAGDGSKNSGNYVGYRGYRRSTSASERLSNDVRSVLQTLGVMATCVTRVLRGGGLVPAKDRSYRFVELASPRNKSLTLDGASVIPVRYDGFEFGIAEPTYDLSVEGEAFVADGLVSHNTNGNAELCLFAKRGRPQRVAKNVKQLVLAPRGRHSAKPPEVRNRIVQLMGDLPRVELFARERCDGWSCWGSEVDSDLVLEAGQWRKTGGVHGLRGGAGSYRG